MLYEFRYLSPRTLPDLLATLAEHAADGQVLAGGTDLLPNIRNGIRKPAFVIDSKLYPGAADLRWSESEGLHIGPAATISDVMRNKTARELFPTLCACAHELASHQVRNRATVAGNVVNASPCSDMAPALLCLGARAIVERAGGDRRELAFAGFFAGVKKTVLRPGEYLSGIVVPASAAKAKGRYLKLKRIAGHDLGIVGVLMTEKDGVLRFGVSSAAPTPVLVETVARKDGPEEAVRKVLASVSPIDDVRSTKAYREHMIGVYVRRLLEEVR